MTSTYQTQLTDQTYNGWANYETWNVSLWIQNDEGLYHLAKDFAKYGYRELANFLMDGSLTTPDGVKWDDDNLNICELDDMMEEL